MRTIRIVLVIIACIIISPQIWCQFSSVNGNTQSIGNTLLNGDISFGGSLTYKTALKISTIYAEKDILGGAIAVPMYEGTIFQITNLGNMEFQSIRPDDPCIISLMRNNVTYGAISNQNDRLNLISENALKVTVNSDHQVASFESDQIKCSENIIVGKSNMDVKVGIDTNKNTGWIGTTTGQGLVLGTNNQTALFMDVNNGVYIGGITVDNARSYKQNLRNKYKLFVKKGILSEDYAIAPTSTWSDFVFNENYRLKNIREVESFIDKNKHLPDVPSAKQVAEEGYSQHDMNKVLLQKIEELTLYIIQQQKEIDGLKRDLSQTNN